jgi:hypothetical protein
MLTLKEFETLQQAFLINCTASFAPSGFYGDATTILTQGVNGKRTLMDTIIDDNRDLGCEHDIKHDVIHHIKSIVLVNEVPPKVGKPVF